MDREKKAVELLNKIDLSSLTLQDAKKIDNGYLREFVESIFRDKKPLGNVMHQAHTSHSDHTSHSNHNNSAMDLGLGEDRTRLQALVEGAAKKTPAIRARRKRGRSG